MQKHHAPQHPAPVNALAAGTRLQEFEIKAVIGEGGFGVVYRADDTLLGREVAIKEYLPVSHATRQSDGRVVANAERQRETFEKGLRCFVAEARMLARFKHPALVEVLRFWEAQGTAYMVMPYYHGRSLHARIQAGFRITDSASLKAFLLPLLDGLTQLHDVDCFHRDISTDNILMLENGQPLLLDFGAARSILVDPSDLSTVILKPGFAPIEQYSEQPDIAPQGAWTDLYALCAVTYQVITGVMPTVSVARIIRDPLTPLVQLAPPDIAPALLAAVDAGLRVKPDERPQSVQALRALMDTEPMANHHVFVMKMTEPIKEKAAAPPTEEADLTQPTLTQHDKAAPTDIRKRRNTLSIGVPLLLVALIGLLIGLYRNGSFDMDDVQKPEAATVLLPSMPPVATNEPAPVRLPFLPQSSADTEIAPTIPATPVEPQADAPHGDELATSASSAADVGASAPELAHVPEQAAQVPEETPEPAPPLVSPLVHAASDGEPGMATRTNAQPAELESPVLIEPQSATLDVRVEPWGNVFVNGELVGVTPPGVRLQVKPGHIDIELRNETHPPKRITLDVKGGRTYQVKHVFENN